MPRHQIKKPSVQKTEGFLHEDYLLEITDRASASLISQRLIRLLNEWVEQSRNQGQWQQGVLSLRQLPNPSFITRIQALSWMTRS